MYSRLRTLGECGVVREGGVQGGGGGAGRGRRGQTEQCLREGMVEVMVLHNCMVSVLCVKPIVHSIL